ncbi:hypothetical protein BC830DRAFT_1117141 [Chytriomyces sp. MP71]|nr:hypothetical protein BC830DRAFT_1117141 [Chytriomyces sp. MP71]
MCSNIGIPIDSGVLPLDHIVDKNGFHLGPQIREFDPVAAEGTATIGICPLTQEARHQVEKKLRVNPYLLKGIYEEFRDYTYPIPNVLPIVASAEDGLYKQLQEFKKTTREWFPFLKDEKRKEIFCSEMVARVLQLLELPTFVATPPESICPLELEVCPEFGGKVYYVKEFKKLMMVDERVSTVSTTANAFQTLEMESKKEHWVPRSPDSGVPPNAIVGGRERDGTPVHIARVQIGDAHYIGKIAAGSTSFPHMTYFGTEVQIHFKYEVLVESGFTWSPASGGLIPLGAVKAGVDLHGEYVYVARAAVGDGFFERLVEAPVHLPGVVSPNLKGARIAHDGEEVHVDRYEVLCHKGSEE